MNETYQPGHELSRAGRIQKAHGEQCLLEMLDQTLHGCLIGQSGLIVAIGSSLDGPGSQKRLLPQDIGHHLDGLREVEGVVLRMTWNAQQGCTVRHLGDRQAGALSPENEGDTVFRMRLESLDGQRTGDLGGLRLGAEFARLCTDRNRERAIGQGVSQFSMHAGVLQKRIRSACKGKGLWLARNIGEPGGHQPQAGHAHVAHCPGG